MLDMTGTRLWVPIQRSGQLGGQQRPEAVEFSGLGGWRDSSLTLTRVADSSLCRVGGGGSSKATERFCKP